MDLTKVHASLADARTAVVEAVRAQKGVILSDTATPAEVSKASRSLQVLGKIDNAIVACTDRINKSVGRIDGSKKKRNRKGTETPAANTTATAPEENKATAPAENKGGNAPAAAPKKK